MPMIPVGKYFQYGIELISDLSNLLSVVILDLKEGVWFIPTLPRSTYVRRSQQSK